MSTRWLDSSARDIAFREWIEGARRVSVKGELKRRGLWSAKMGRRFRRAMSSLRRPGSLCD